MPERTTQRSRREDTDTVESAGTAGSTTATDPELGAVGDVNVDERLDPQHSAVDERLDAQSSGVDERGRATSGRLERLFSVKRFLVGLVLVAAGSIVAGGVVPIAGPLVGIFLAAFVFGLASSTRPMLEASTAGALVAGLTAVFGDLVLALTGFGLPLAAITAGIGAAAGGLGAYFGGDLRDGLTREI